MGVVRVGVIGAGVIGERHCRVCANLPYIELVGVVDPDEARGRQVANLYETMYFPNHRALLFQIGAVAVAASTPVHCSLSAECLEQGLHIMVEKPITETIEQARRLAQMADERRLVLQVGHIERFNPACVELKHGTGDMKLIGVSMRRLSPFGTSNTDVDVIRALMIHDLDLAVDVVGLEIEGIDAWGRSIDTEAIDHAVASLPFKDGSIVTLFVSRVGARGFGE